MGSLGDLLESEGIDETGLIEMACLEGVSPGICRKKGCHFIRLDMEVDGQGDCEECDGVGTVIAGARLAGVV